MKKSMSDKPVSEATFFLRAKVVDEQFKKADKQFKNIDEQFKKIDEQFKKIDERFKKVDERFEKIDKRFEDVDKRFEDVDKRFDRIEERLDTFVTKDVFFFAMGQIEKRFCDIEEKMYTKADHMKFMEWMDEAMTEVRDSREERKLFSAQMARLGDITFDHEKRICVLEESK